MKISAKYSYFIWPIFGLMIGSIIPISYIVLDLQELGLNFNLKNVYWVISGQKIMLITTILFPIIFTCLGILYSRLRFRSSQLLHAYQYVDSIFNSINDYIMVIDASGNILRMNQTLKKNIGVGQLHLQDFILTSGGGKIDIEKNLTKLREKQIKNVELKFRSVNGDIPILFSSDRLNTDEANERIVCVMRDISELKDLEEEVEYQRAQAGHSAKLASLGEMASAVAHEINNPLAIINLKTKVLEKELEKLPTPPTPIVKQSLETICKTVANASKIIKSFRNLAHYNAHEEFEKGNLLEIFEDILPLIKDKSNSLDINIEINLNEEAFRTVLLLRRVQLSQVLINVLNNALDAIKSLPQKNISIQSLVMEEKILLKVIDSGTTPNEEMRKKIFLPFFTTKPVGMGTGLGLSISYNIMKQHFGDLYIDEQSHHTTFVIEIPKEEVLLKLKSDHKSDQIEKAG